MNVKEQQLNIALRDLRTEVLRAFDKHASMHSAHEGHSVIREELEELWEHVRADTGGTDGARKEALQVAAMALRYAVDICGYSRRPVGVGGSAPRIATDRGGTYSDGTE